MDAKATPRRRAAPRVAAEKASPRPRTPASKKKKRANQAPARATTQGEPSTPEETGSVTIGDGAAGECAAPLEVSPSSKGGAAPAPLSSETTAREEWLPTGGDDAGMGSADGSVTDSNATDALPSAAIPSTPPRSAAIAAVAVTTAAPATPTTTTPTRTGRLEGLRPTPSPRREPPTQEAASIASTRAARRRDRQRLRLPVGGAARERSGDDAATPQDRSQRTNPRLEAELRRLTAEREKRTLSLFDRLEQISAGAADGTANASCTTSAEASDASSSSGPASGPASDSASDSAAGLVPASASVALVRSRPAALDDSWAPSAHARLEALGAWPSMPPSWCTHGAPQLVVPRPITQLAELTTEPPTDFTQPPLAPRAAPPSTALARAGSRALAPMADAAMVTVDSDNATGLTIDGPALLRMLRGSDSRRWLRQWLSVDGRAAKVRSLLERTPEPARHLLVDVLTRLLNEDDAPDPIVMLGRHARIVHHDGPGGSGELLSLPPPAFAEAPPGAPRAAGPLAALGWTPQISIPSQVLLPHRGASDAAAANHGAPEASSRVTALVRRVVPQ